MSAKLKFGGAFALAILSMSIPVLLSRNIDRVYQSALLNWISEEATEGIDKKDKYAIVNALFEYTNQQMDRRMMPGHGRAAIEYLAYGYALCDQEAMVLDHLLYQQGIEARVVPLYYPDGRSDHTMMEWRDGDNWLLLDPHFDHQLNIPARLLTSLPKEEVLRRYGSVTSQVYDFYRERYFAELMNTYAKDGYRTRFHLVKETSTRQKLIDAAVVFPLKWFGKDYLALLQKLYLRKPRGKDDLDGRYLLARNAELLGHCDDALDIYKDIIARDIPADFPHYDTYVLNKKMLSQRLEINLKHCPRPVAATHRARSTL